MIRSGNVRQNKRLLDFADQCFAGLQIIDPPTDISCPGTGAETPPTVSDGVWVEMPKGIDQSGVEKTAEAVDFDLGITGRFIEIRLRTGDINFPVRDIKIPASDQWFFTFQLLQIGQKFQILALAVIQPRQFLARIRYINVEQKKLFKFGDHHAAFPVVFDNANIVNDL